MSNNRKNLTIVLAIITVVILSINGCTKDTTIIIQDTAVITRAVSFSQDIQPIFKTSCNNVGCHNTGEKKPDLSQANAYASLISGNYTNVSQPENSELYLWLTGQRATAMPMGAAKNPDSINELVLAWITQGAENN